MLTGLGAAYQPQVADALADVLADGRRSYRFRVDAVRALVQLGKQFHRVAVDWYLRLLRENTRADLDIDMADFQTVGTGLRAELAQVVRELMSDPDAGPARASSAARALVQLGHRDDPTVIATLRAVALDQSADRYVRYQAAAALAEIAPANAPDAITVLRHIAASVPISPWTREQAIFKLSRLGEDPVPLIRVLFADQDAARKLRETAATTLAKLHPELMGEAIAELRHQADDVHLEFRDRTDVLTRLAILDPSTCDHTARFLQSLVDDDDEPVDVRCPAASQLVELDRTYWPATVTSLRRLATSPSATPTDQADAIQALDELNALRLADAIQLTLGVIHHPAASAYARQGLLKLLPSSMRLDAERALLDDHTAPIRVRVYDQDHPLGAEGHTAARDVLDAVESSLSERVEAAAALASTSSRL
ncbi:MAG: hypothetical protein ACREX8_08505, partial [Gammaproteobacteria bacterium]